MTTARSLQWITVIALVWGLLERSAEGAPDGQAAADYLPTEVEYQSDVPTPESVLGFQVGEWHVRHDLIVQYLQRLAEASPRVEVTEYGRTHEERPLLLAKISSQENLGNLEEIRCHHVAAALGREAPKEDRPIVAWMGYSIHGDEASGANASLLLAYYLAATCSDQVNDLLESTVVLIDPCLNPDGLDRFAQWVTSHRGKHLIADPDHRQHRQRWPGGRGNHYWFDLNRDWLLLTHPESRGRLEAFHRWKPNILTDFHEMGRSSTYFFQPGVPSRQNPWTSDRNLELTHKIARFHAKALDQKGELYYTEERFDDYYYGKGSTYPDVNGSVGILFEQASSRGHIQERPQGEVSFQTTIQNQLTTSLSTLRAGSRLRDELLSFQREFFEGAIEKARKDRIRGYVFKGPQDPMRGYHFIDILRRHQIRVYQLGKTLEIEDRHFKPESGYIVPLAQPQYRLIHSLFETRTEFPDHTFYDVSTWNLPLSFGLPYSEVPVECFERELLGQPIESAVRPTGDLERAAEPYAFLFEWSGYYAPRALNRLLSNDIKAGVATKPFKASIDGEPRSFDRGTIVVPSGIQEESRDAVVGHLEKIADRDGIQVSETSTGLTPEGIDLGSPSIEMLEPIKPLLLVGEGFSAYEAGEVWHLLDQRYDIKLTMVDRTRFDHIDLGEYTHLILVSGDYNNPISVDADRLQAWVREGGVLISLRGSVPWTESQLLDGTGTTGTADKDAEKKEESEEAEHEKREEERLRYADYDDLKAEQEINGAIFKAHIDTTHPLAFGYQRSEVPVLRSSTIIMEPESNPFANVMQYVDSPLVSGYASPENLEAIRGSAVLCATRLGQGAVVRIVDNPNFRGVWYGTNKLFANSLFFAPILEPTDKP